MSTRDNCAVPENIHTPPQKVLEFPGGGVFCKAKILIGISREVGGGGGGGRVVLEKIHSVREVWIFSGVREFCKTKILIGISREVGGGGGLRKNSFSGGGMDIFWSCTLGKTMWQGTVRWETQAHFH